MRSVVANKRAVIQESSCAHTGRPTGAPTAVDVKEHEYGNREKHQ